MRSNSSKNVVQIVSAVKAGPIVGKTLGKSSPDERGIWKLEVAKCDIKLRGRSKLPSAFTEHPVSMLPSALNSERTVSMNHDEKDHLKPCYS
jgi:hypothetical protein